HRIALKGAAPSSSSGRQAHSGAPPPAEEGCCRSLQCKVPPLYGSPGGNHEIPE
ncbi:hypothetical protein ABVT39_016089, partial [Epinephelus coioides]